MHSLVLGDNNNCTFMHDFWIFVRPNMATLAIASTILVTFVCKAQFIDDPYRC